MAYYRKDTFLRKVEMVEIILGVKINNSNIDSLYRDILKIPDCGKKFYRALWTYVHDGRFNGLVIGEV